MIAPSAVLDLIAFIALFVALVCVTVLIVAIRMHLQLKWLKAVLIPYFSSVAQFLNPEKK